MWKSILLTRSGSKYFYRMLPERAKGGRKISQPANRDHSDKDNHKERKSNIIASCSLTTSPSTSPSPRSKKVKTYKLHVFMESPVASGKKP
jgi:hypothetical protein